MGFASVVADGGAVITTICCGRCAWTHNAVTAAKRVTRIQEDHKSTGIGKLRTWNEALKLKTERLRDTLPRLRLNNAENVICRRSEVTIKHRHPSTYSYTYQTLNLALMSSTTLPRTALRSLARAARSTRTSTPRIAARCLHQKSSPITSSPVQRRPNTQPWSQAVSIPNATFARRTMFIQTETTPNADVRSSSTPQSHVEACPTDM
jgi:hypothetical protein